MIFTKIILEMDNNVTGSNIQSHSDFEVIWMQMFGWRRLLAYSATVKDNGWWKAKVINAPKDTHIRLCGNGNYAKCKQANYWNIRKKTKIVWNHYLPAVVVPRTWPDKYHLLVLVLSAKNSSWTTVGQGAEL